METGQLESPNYPEDYQPNKECIWRITVPVGFQVALKFQSFEVKAYFIYLHSQAFLGDVLTKTQLTKNSKELNFLAFFGKNLTIFGNSTDLLQILLHKKI